MTKYALGHSEQELERLELQALVLRPITRRLLSAAGICPGMRVLDIGCGAGDTTMLLAEFLGAQGEIVAIDPSEAAVASATTRVRQAGATNVSVRQTSLEAAEFDAPFDFAFGRYVIFHQRDPEAFLRKAASHLKPDGILAFHEMNLAMAAQTMPPIPKLDTLLSEAIAFARANIVSFDIARRLVASFHQADLPVPDVFCERPAAGRDPRLILRWLTDAIVTFRLISHPHEPPLNMKELLSEFEQAAFDQKSQIASFDQWCVWTRLSDGAAISHNLLREPDV